MDVLNTLHGLNSLIKSNENKLLEGDNNKFLQTDQQSNVNDANTELDRNLTNNEWMSANSVLENVIESFDDLFNYNGIIYKTLLNEYIKQKKRDEELQLLKDSEIKPVDDEDGIEKLIRNLRECKNRKEKRKLLAKYNKSKSIAWGSSKVIYKADDVYADTTQEVEKRVKLNKNSNNQNTQIIKPRLSEEISNTRRQLAAPFKSFDFKIDLKKQKALQLENQSKLKVLLQNPKEERTNVFLPNEAIKKSLEYLKDDESKKKLMQNIKEKTESKSINIIEYIESKKTKFEKRLNTKYEDSSKSIGSPYSNNLLGLETEKRGLLDFERKLNEEDSSQLSKILSNNVVKASTDISDPIQFQRKGDIVKSINTSKKPNTNNKTILIDKKVYTADTQYNNTNLEHIMYEKDTDISRSLQFERKPLHKRRNSNNK